MKIQTICFLFIILKFTYSVCHFNCSYPHALCVSTSCECQTQSNGLEPYDSGGNYPCGLVTDGIAILYNYTEGGTDYCWIDLPLYEYRLDFLSSSALFCYLDGLIHTDSKSPNILGFKVGTWSEQFTYNPFPPGAVCAGDASESEEFLISASFNCSTHATEKLSITYGDTFQMALVPEYLLPEFAIFTLYTPDCNGVPRTDELVCNNKGECDENGTCNCTENYLGINCDYWKCDNVSSLDDSVCNSNGNCTDFNNCTCDDGWTGDYCSELEGFECFNISSTNISVCSGNGNCTSLDNCTCNTGWSGDNCITFTIADNNIVWIISIIIPTVSIVIIVIAVIFVSKLDTKKSHKTKLIKI